MPDFTNYNDLFKYIKKNLKLSLEQVAQQVQQMVKDYINQELYVAYQPKEYDRTYEFLNSVSVSNVEEITNGSYSVKIYFDTNLIYPHINPGFWNAHADIWGNDQSENIPLWLERGTTGGLFPREGIHSMESVRQDLITAQKYVKMIKKHLEEKGFKVEL